MYASRRSPALLPDEISSYAPRAKGSWDDVIKRAIEIEDDGHTAKLVRALRSGQDVCGEFEGREGFRVKGDEWRVLGNMVVDSVGVEPRWVRSAGFEEAWEEVGLREGARL